MTPSTPPESAILEAKELLRQISLDSYEARGSEIIIAAFIEKFHGEAEELKTLLHRVASGKEPSRLLDRAEAAESLVNSLRGELAEAKYSPLSTISKGRMTWTEAVAESVKQTTDALRGRDEARAEVERLKQKYQLDRSDRIKQLTSLLAAKDEALKFYAEGRHEGDGIYGRGGMDAIAIKALALTPEKPKEDDNG